MTPRLVSSPNTMVSFGPWMLASRMAEDDRAVESGRTEQAIQQQREAKIQPQTQQPQNLLVRLQKLT